MSFSSFYKKCRRPEWVLSGLLVPMGEERMWREGVGGWTCWKYCVHIYANVKMRPVVTIPGIGEEGSRENVRRAELN
jgi:hypothetical protein